MLNENSYLFDAEEYRHTSSSTRVRCHVAFADRIPHTAGRAEMPLLDAYLATLINKCARDQAFRWHLSIASPAASSNAVRAMLPPNQCEPADTHGREYPATSDDSHTTTAPSMPIPM